MRNRFRWATAPGEVDWRRLLPSDHIDRGVSFRSFTRYRSLRSVWGWRHLRASPGAPSFTSLASTMSSLACDHPLGGCCKFVRDRRLWYMDWELEPRTAASWDDGARPYLGSFLAFHANRHGRLRSSAARTREQFDQLLHTLGCAGYGWLHPDGVMQELRRLASDWNGPPLAFTSG
jgi:hypothetical protein